jgi:predicted DNA-binding transcriptional regulator AlpA
MRGREGFTTCPGCGARFRESALDETGLCPECSDESELENLSDLDDEEERGVKTSDIKFINGIKFKNGVRVHGAACRGGGHKSPHHLLDDPVIAREMCAEARSAAQLAIAGALTGLAAGSIADVPAAAPEGEDVMLSVKEAAARTGLSTGALYRDKTLPFRVQLSPGRVRFSSKGIDAFIRAKTAA